MKPNPILKLLAKDKTPERDDDMIVSSILCAACWIALALLIGGLFADGTVTRWMR